MITCYVNDSGGRNSVRKIKKSSWKDILLRGTYHRQIEADIQKTYQWLERAGLRVSTRTGLEGKIN